MLYWQRNGHPLRRQIALVDLLAYYNILPSRVAGHSAGEIAAAYAAGYLTRPEALAVAYYRGRGVSETEQLPGAMLALGLSAAQSQELIPKYANVVIGAVNSPRSVTLSGDADAIATMKQRCDKDKIFNRLIATKGRAYHSSYMENAAEAYSIPLHDFFRSSERPKIRAQYFSTVTGALWTEGEIPMSYWRRNMESPVLFSAAVSEMRKAGMTRALEIGPHSTLRSPILDIVKSLVVDPPRPFTYLSTIKRMEDIVQSVLTTCGELLVVGYDVDVLRVNGEGRLLIDFPAYPWDHSRKFVSENKADQEWRFRRFPRHDLLGSLTPGSALSTRIWRNVLSLNNVPWLADHKVGQHYIFPAAGFMSMAVEAMRQVRETIGDVFILEDVHIGVALMVDNDIEVFLTMRKQALGNSSISNTWWEFNISSVKYGISTEHAKGRVSNLLNTIHHRSRILPTSDMSGGQPITEERWYETITRNKGLTFGNSFRRLSEIIVEPQQHRAIAKIKVETSSDMTGMKYESQYVVHPTVLDNCLQLSVLAAGSSSAGQAYVPVSVNKITIFEERGDEVYATLESTGQYIGFKGLCGTAQLMDPTGQTMIGLEGLRFVGIPAGGDLAPSRKREAF